jgi:hypothetical protein
MNMIIGMYNKITRRDQVITRCINCNKTEEDLAGKEQSDTKNVQRFSDEKMCLNCEILLYPERFHGCGFCKRPIRENFCCSICKHGFNTWIRSEIRGSDALSQMIKISANSLLDRTVSSKKEYDQMQEHRFILRTSDSYFKWPGFYAGVTDKFSNTDFSFFPVWIIPKLDTKHCIKYTKLKPDTKMFQCMILEILEANNIHLYRDIQIDTDIFDMKKIITVNPYDTRIVK